MRLVKKEDSIMSDYLKNFDEQFGWEDLFGDIKDEEDKEDRQLEAREVEYLWKKVFEAIGTPDYQSMLNEASDLFIEMQDDVFIDPQQMAYSYAKAISYRNKLIRLKIKMRRIYAAKNRSFASLSRSIIGKQRGTRVEKESKAGDILSTYEKEVGDAKDALDTLNDIIDNLDSTAMQLSRILRLLEIRPNSYYTSLGNSSLANSDEDSETDTSDWGSSRSLYKQMNN
jgi:hypothetical protein